MNGTVAPPSSNSTAACTWAGLAAISSAIRCSIESIGVDPEGSAVVKIGEQERRAGEQARVVAAAIEPARDAGIEDQMRRGIVVERDERLMTMIDAPARVARQLDGSAPIGAERPRGGPRPGIAPRGRAGHARGVAHA